MWLVAHRHGRRHIPRQAAMSKAWSLPALDLAHRKDVQKGFARACRFRWCSRETAIFARRLVPSDPTCITVISIRVVATELTWLGKQ